MAKRALNAGEFLDGEGGYTVYGKLIPARRSLREGALPIGLAHGVKLIRAVAAGALLTWTDIEPPLRSAAYGRRREMEKVFLPV